MLIRFSPHQMLELLPKNRKSLHLPWQNIHRALTLWYKLCHSNGMWWFHFGWWAQLRVRVRVVVPSLQRLRPVLAYVSTVQTKWWHSSEGLSAEARLTRVPVRQTLTRWCCRGQNRQNSGVCSLSCTCQKQIRCRSCHSPMIVHCFHHHQLKNIV